MKIRVRKFQKRRLRRKVESKTRNDTCTKSFTSAVLEMLLQGPETGKNCKNYNE
jgi:hypothetical protein